MTTEPTSLRALIRRHLAAGLTIHAAAEAALNDVPEKDRDRWDKDR